MWCGCVVTQHIKIRYIYIWRSHILVSNHFHCTRTALTSGRCPACSPGRAACFVSHKHSVEQAVRQFLNFKNCLQPLEHSAEHIASGPELICGDKQRRGSAHPIRQQHFVTGGVHFNTSRVEQGVPFPACWCGGESDSRPLQQQQPAPNGKRLKAVFGRMNLAVYIQTRRQLNFPRN